MRKNRNSDATKRMDSLRCRGVEGFRTSPNIVTFPSAAGCEARLVASHLACLDDATPALANGATSSIG